MQKHHYLSGMIHLELSFSMKAKVIANILTATLLCSSECLAQNHTIYNERIASLQVVAGTDWLQPPIISLNDGKVINISFDDLTHVYHRYTYTITHCESDWSKSEELFVSDYIAGFQDAITIDDCEESINTNQLYTHYKLQIPNDECRLRISGNYRLDVIDDETRDTMFTARFMVVEPLVNTSITINTNTDIDIRKKHQQVDVRIDYPNTLKVTDPRRQFKVKVLQNDCTYNMTECPPAPILMNNGMQWTHTRDLIFDAGNEYHKFEILDVHRNSLNVEYVRWDETWYNIHLYHDIPRPSYVYDEDANGSFILRNSDNTIDSDVISEYVKVHFYLDTPKLDGDVYVDGKWAINSLSEQYRMEYDEEQKCYHLEVPLKLGYYSYQYLYVPQDTGIPVICPTEGNFYETENNYTVYTYYRPNGERTDRLVGVNSKRTR